MSEDIDVRDDVVEGTLEETGKDLPMLRSMMQQLAMEAELDASDLSTDFVMELMEGILNAGSAEEIFAAQETGMMSGKDFAGRPFYLSSDNIQVRRTSFEGKGLPFYFMLKVVEVATGEEVVVNCGGQTFLAALQGLRNIDYFDATEENPMGRAISLVSHASPAGAYLTIAPYRVPAPPAATKKRAK
jgi:hypothetical protein